MPTHALNYYIQKWKDCIRYLGNRLFMFRTWRIRQCNPVWVCKLTDVVTSLWLEIIKLDKELFNVLYIWKPSNVIIFGINEDYYDLNYNGRTKLSIFLIRYSGTQSDLTQVTTLKRKKSEAQPLSWHRQR